MAGQFFLGVGQTVVGVIGTAATLGLNDSVKDFTWEGAGRIEDNAAKAWGADGEVTKFAESLPGKVIFFPFPFLSLFWFVLF